VSEVSPVVKTNNKKKKENKPEGRVLEITSSSNRSAFSRGGG